MFCFCLFYKSIDEGGCAESTEKAGGNWNSPSPRAAPGNCRRLNLLLLLICMWVLPKSTLTSPPAPHLRRLIFPWSPSRSLMNLVSSRRKKIGRDFNLKKLFYRFKTYWISQNNLSKGEAARKMISVFWFGQNKEKHSDKRKPVTSEDWLNTVTEHGGHL